MQTKKTKAKKKTKTAGYVVRFSALEPPSTERGLRVVAAVLKRQAG